MSLVNFTYCQKLRVAIASSLISPMTEIVSAFEKESSINIELIPGASGAMTNQILNGAPYDLIISADLKYCKLLEDNKIGKSEKSFFFFGELAIWSINELDTINYTVEEILKSSFASNLKTTIGIANPQLAPYGEKTVTWFNSIGLNISNEENLITGNSISATNQYIVSKATDFVVTSASSKMKLAGQVDGYWYYISSINAYKVSHCICTITSNPSINKFILFLQNSTSTSILIKYDYTRQID